MCDDLKTLLDRVLTLESQLVIFKQKLQENQAAFDEPLKILEQKLQEIQAAFDDDEVACACSLISVSTMDASALCETSCFSANAINAWRGSG